MSKALSTVKRALVRDRIRAALDRVGWSVAEDAAFRESVQTPFEKCRAKDKLSCKYHGAQALFKILSQELPDVGIGTYKTSDGGYAANIDVSAEEAKNAIGKALEGMGYEITNAVDISDGQSQIFIAKKEAPSDEIDNLSPDESMEAGLEELDKFLEDNLTEEDEATLAEMEALLEEDAIGGVEENENTPLSECKAADPLTCPYHGVKALTNVVMGAFPGLSEANGDYEVEMADNGGFYIDIKATSDEVKQKIEPFLNSIGYEIKSAKDYDFDGTSLVKIGKKEIAEEKPGTTESPVSEPVPEAKKKPKKTKASKKVAEALENAGFVADIPEGILPPLEHDDEKFPQGITQDELDDAIKHGKKAGGHGGLGTTIVEIGGKKYVCKSGSGKKAIIIKNGYNADMAYRAGGVYAPDAQLYDFGDGKTYKLSEFVEGKRLIDVWKNADEAERDKIRSELLKGYPLDVLFSNYDVLGTSPEESQSVTVIGPDGKPIHTSVAFDNVIIGNDGHAYRIDNDGAFAMTGTGGVKHSEPGQFGGKVAYETWDKWQDRQWIDDFRTLRRNPKNAGVFDRYSTADIFLSAGNIDLGRAVDSLPDGLQKALAKPLFEMKQMTMRTVAAEISGVKNREMLSHALDAAYEASKQNFREMCTGEISFSSGGIGAKKSDKDSIPPFPKPKPEPPEDPAKKFAAGQMLSNSEYTGGKVAEIILNAAKTINYHAGLVMTDENGNKLGGGNALPTPDYKPNSGKIDAFKKIDREKLAKLAETDADAKSVLDYYDSVAVSMANGFTQPVQAVKPTNISSSLPTGYKTAAETDFETHKAEVMAKFKQAMDEYTTVTLPKYNQEKQDYETAEKAKLASGKAGLQGNFYDIANEFMEAAYNTDGIAQNNGEGIGFVEKGKYQNKYGGGVSGSTTSNDSWTPASSRLKIMELLLKGMTIDQIAKIKDDDPTINNGHWSGSKAKKWFTDEAKELMANPTQMQRELAAYAVFKGLQVVKLENESAPISVGGKTVPWIDHANHSVALIRKEGGSFSAQSGVNSVEPVFQKGGNVSCGFQSNGCIGYTPFAYEVPLWNVSYTYTDENHKHSTVDSYQGSEHEWVANLVGLTPFHVDASVNASKNVMKMRSDGKVGAERKKRTSRLAPFFTTMAELKKMKASA